ncbi:MAG TPA: ribosome maturation factor RimM [Verrucomicrobiae bacterium]|nr:ribosome maturation factor RimM [Verrucomicrobiae bacterium]
MEAVELGRVIGAFGVKGWIRVHSFTAPPEGILRYRKWLLAGREWKVVEGQWHGGAVVASLAGLVDRDAAQALNDETITVPRAALPKAKQGEFYWTDVLGSEVVSTQGAQLGRLESLTSNGAQDVMVVRGERERLIPFVIGAIVKNVDPKAKRIEVEWEPEW